MKKHYRHENDCLNCGAELQGKYCHSCGQENLQIKESFGHMITHAVSDYFHFDHQFFHTLKPLFFSPGKLTNEYMAGRRVQYLHPVKMYIFVSLVYFLVLFSSKDREVLQINNGKPGEKKETRKAAQKEQEKIINNIRENPALTADQKERAIAALNNKMTITKGKDGKMDTTYTTTDVFLTSTKDTSYQQYLANQQKLAPEKRDGFLTRYYNKKAIAWNKRGGSNSKEMIGEAVKHNTPKLMFFLLPMFALMLKITFYKNKKFYVEHLIYTFHLHCFLFLFLTIVMLLKLAIPDRFDNIEDTLETISVLAILLYLFWSLKVVYRRSAFRTITKMIGLLFSYILVFGVSFVLLVIITAIISI
jgi:hypothetical protein